MRALLDTCAFLWMVAQPDKLSGAARAFVVQGGNELLVSAASAFEISIKRRLGRLELVPSDLGTAAFLSRAMERLALTPLDVSIVHASGAGEIDHAHRDPFDRLLAAQALSERLPLISPDPFFRDLDVRVIW